MKVNVYLKMKSIKTRQLHLLRSLKNKVSEESLASRISPL